MEINFKMSQNRKKFIFVSGTIIIIIAVLFILDAGKKPFQILKKQSFDSAQSPNCPVEEKQEIVRGDSLEPIVKNGQEVKILYGYYKCNEVKRDDIVAFDYKGNPAPIIKIIKAVPQDKFGFVQSKEKNGWHILVNNKILKNSQGIPYLINATSYKLLSLYEHDFKGMMPKNVYLILGNLPTGSLDSTRFGLVGKDGIIGKVEQGHHLSQS